MGMLMIKFIVPLRQEKNNRRGGTFLENFPSIWTKTLEKDKKEGLWMKRRWNWLLAAVLTVSLLAGCGSASVGKGESYASTASMDMAETEVSMPMEAPATEEAFDAGGGAQNQRQTQGEKLIYTADLQMETTEFDQATAAIEALTAECGGYFESSSVSSWGRGYRNASYTVRVPAERYGDFLTQAGERCHVLNKQEYTDNVTEAYYDVDGRLKTQQTKLERLQELLSKAESMEDIITIESAISETEYTIDSLSGELRYYDDLVSYSTITLSVSEVYRLSGTEEPADSFGARLGGAFVSGWQGFLGGLEDLAVALAYGWMWVLLVIAAAVLAVCWLRHRRAKRRRQALQEEQKP